LFHLTFLRPLGLNILLSFASKKVMDFLQLSAPQQIWMYNRYCQRHNLFTQWWHRPKHQKSRPNCETTFGADQRCIMLNVTCANIHVVNSLWFSFTSTRSYSLNLNSGDVYIVADGKTARKTS
jgi:hypothetical protein